MLLPVIVFLCLHISTTIQTCPNFCQCYSASDGYHIICRNANLSEIPLTLIRFLQITVHQNLILDLSSNSLSIISCQIFQIPTILRLTLTDNRIQSLPLCFSQSSIEYLKLNKNQLQFNETTILSSSKLLYLDISENAISRLPRTFFFHLRRLQTLVLNHSHELFQADRDQWIRSLSTRNQLTLVICDEHFHLPFCLFNHLFQLNKILTIELNGYIHCDCSFVYLPFDKIRFQYCQSDRLTDQHGRCDIHSSRFARGYSLIELQNETYRQLCAKEYQTCQTLSWKRNSPLSPDFDVSRNESTIKQVQITTMTTTFTAETSSKRDNTSAGAIIPFVLILLLVTIVCLYVVLSGHFFRGKTQQNINGLIDKRKKQQTLSSVSRTGNADRRPTQFDEGLSVDNVNMNSNPRHGSFYQRRYSDSDDGSELTFYSIINDQKASSTSFIQSSMTDSASSTSTIDSSASNETVIVSCGNKQRKF
ncbi:unnamed protein product [Adineta ricciae]|uniref:Uncharacterized protein n=1 Tax=Adineta ricciae TaxID=249248 RepID=A0A814EWY9_ADIRI|nr:unnamed protein product [Adineta ricciae]